MSKPIPHEFCYLCKNSKMNCPCCSGKIYEECCAPFHRKEKHAPTAEALMRSRYSAYAILMENI